MSRTIRKGRYGTKFNDGKPDFYKCKCSWCIASKYRYKKQLTIKEDLSL